MGFRKMMTALTGVIWDLALAAGAAAVAMGIGMIYLPAGVIAGGVLTMALGALGALGESKGGSNGKDGDGG